VAHLRNSPTRFKAVLWFDNAQEKTPDGNEPSGVLLFDG
jgi:hypothetical protein